MKTKVKSYGDEATDFHDKEMPKAGSNHTCLAVIIIDSVLKKRIKLLSASVFNRMQIQYIEKEVIRHTGKDIYIFSSDTDEE